MLTPQIWTEQQIADFLQLSHGYVKANVITVEDFPKPITYGKRAGIQGKRTRRRYFADEVISYFREKERSKQTQQMRKIEVRKNIEEIAERAKRLAVLSMRGIR